VFETFLSRGFPSHICERIRVKTRVKLCFTAQTLVQSGLQCCSLGENGAKLTLLLKCVGQGTWCRCCCPFLYIHSEERRAGFVAFLSLRKMGTEASKPTALPIEITRRRLWWVCPVLLSSPFLTRQKKRLEGPWPGEGVCAGSTTAAPSCTWWGEQQGEEGSSDSHSENGLHVLH